MEQSRPEEQRVVRVFVSSTFRDMHEEREELVKRVFPQLRKLCESREVVWGEVDLRWGITDEDLAEGKVLPLCLEEIRRCRPYFIGLLGERYGWIPDSIPGDLVEREPWLQEHRDHSLTELEILHGVLRNPDMAAHAFFYFRDPEFGNRVHLPQEDFASEDPLSAGKLRDLKTRIRQSGLPLRENYSDPRALGDLVLRDLTAVVDRLFPEGSQPDDVDREASRQRAFARARARIFVNRPGLFERLDAHVDGSDPPLIIHGAPGCGKSAVLAAWALRNVANRPDALLMIHFVGATPGSVDPAATLRRLTADLERRCEIRPRFIQNPYALREHFNECLGLASASAKIVLVVDGADRLSGGLEDLNWLPTAASARVRVVISTSEGPLQTEFAGRGWPTLAIEPLSVPERRVFISEYLAQYAKTLGPALTERVAAAAPTGSPLFLQTLLEELRVHGDHFTLAREITHYLGARSPMELDERILGRFERDSESERADLVRDAMGLLWASREGLSESELLDLLGTGDQPLAHRTFSPLFLAAERSVFDVASLVRLANDDVREAVRRRYVDSEDRQRALHLRLAVAAGRGASENGGSVKLGHPSNTSYRQITGGPDNG